ncbi:MAG: RCC1 domain-containing protein, partial [Acidimicrobiia bacterium]
MSPSPARRADYAITGSVALGFAHALALKVDRTLWAWGTNATGQLGNGTTTTAQAPVQVLSGVGTISTSGDGSGGHSLAVKVDGTVWGWGRNTYGQLGDGSTTTPRLTPVQALGLTSMVAVAAGASHTLGLRSDGTVWAWGYNGYGQLGRGSTPPGSTPAPVSGLGGVIAIAAGTFHSLALKADGTVWAWGYNGSGQLGDGSQNQRSTPGLVGQVKGAVAIAASGHHSLALCSSGTAAADVWAWGYNDVGQLGDGTSQYRTVPQQVLSDALAVVTGVRQTLYLRSNLTSSAVWGTGQHAGVFLAPRFRSLTAPAESEAPVFIAGGPFALLAAGYQFSVVVSWDTTVLLWGALGATFPAADGFALGHPTGAEDPDQDGLTTAQEWSLGSDP